MKINLHIERVVLEGLPVRRLDAGRFRESLQAEVAGLFAAGAWPDAFANGAAMPHLHAADIRLQQGEQPIALAQRLARAVHSAIRAQIPRGRSASADIPRTARRPQRQPQRRGVQ